MNYERNYEHKDERISRMYHEAIANDYILQQLEKRKEGIRQNAKRVMPNNSVEYHYSEHEKYLLHYIDNGIKSRIEELANYYKNKYCVTEL